MVRRRDEVVVKFLGDSSGPQGLDSTLDRVKGKISTFGPIALGMGAAVAGGLALAAKAAFDLGAKFDDASDKIRIGTGATGKALKDLEGDFKKVFGSTATSADDASTAIADLNTRLGLTGKPLQDLAKNMLDLTRMTGGDLGANIETVTRLFGDWNVKSEDQVAALDKVFRASQATGVGIDALARITVQYGAPLRNLGFGFEQALALMSSFEKAGVNTEAVMGGLKIGVGKLAKAGEDIPTVFARVVTEIQNAKTASEGTAKAIELFGQRAGPDLADAIRGGKFEIGELTKLVADGEETIQGASDDTSDFAESWQKFKNTVELAVEPVATRFFNLLGEKMDELGPKVPGLVNIFIREFGKLATFLDELNTWAGALLSRIAQDVNDTVRFVKGAIADSINNSIPFWNPFGENTTSGADVFRNEDRIVVPPMPTFPSFNMAPGGAAVFIGTNAAESRLTGGTPFASPSTPSVGGGGFFIGGDPVSQGGFGGGSVRKMAKGGVVTRPTFAMIGEAGPEAVIPLNKAGAMGVTINVAGSVVTERDLARLVRDELVRIGRANGTTGL